MRELYQAITSLEAHLIGVLFLYMTEQEILNTVYALYEGDTTNWGTTSDEYLAARIYANAAINRWEFYEMTNWKELWVSLDDAADGDKTLTAGTYAYDCPSDMVKPASFVRTNSTTYWNVVPLSRVPSLSSSSDAFCYFTGNKKDGFVLNFNPNTTLTTGDTINYEYYKEATTFTTTTDETEMADPYFIVYFILSRLYENDGEDGRASKAFQEAEARLENMRTQNIMGLENVDDWIQDSTPGFGV